MPGRRGRRPEKKRSKGKKVLLWTGGTMAFVVLAAGAGGYLYLKHLEGLVWPKLFVLGGGITKNPEKWLQHLHPRTPINLAELINNAGIVGAADAAR